MLHAVPTAEVVPISSDVQGVDAALRLLGSGGGSDSSGSGADRQQQQQQQQAGAEQLQRAQQQQEASAGSAGGEQAPDEQTSQQQQPSSRSGKGRPPDLLYLQLADVWGHLEDGALQLAEQVNAGKGWREVG